MKKIKCPNCSEKFTDINGLYSHIEDDHTDLIPDGYSAKRYLYYTKTGKTHGSCVMCKKDTEWNESTGKYKRFCDNPKCKEEYRKMFEERMKGKYGKTTLLDDPEQQRKMLANRHISGKYRWSDGSSDKSYTGSYELDFLKMLDVFMNFESDDVMTPSPHTYYYIYEGEKKFYIPDVYIPSLNLEIEIKDGGSNPNMHHKIVAVDRVKEKLKDEVMASQKDIDYIKIVDKNYDGFFKYLLDKKEELANARDIKFTSIATESCDRIVTEGSFDIKEHCKSAPIDESPEILDLLTKTITDGHHIYLATDWHLWKYDKKNAVVYRDFDPEIFVNTHNKLKSENDVLIYLGDLVDDECQNKDEIRDVISRLKCQKILIKGNNDLFDDEFYKSCGFIHVTYKLKWENILFSHFPVKHDCRINIHGHIHGSQEYYVPFNNHVDVFTDSVLATVDIIDAIRQRHEYAKGCVYVADKDTDIVSNDVVTEATAPKIRDVDIYYDFERFVNDDTNLLFITGISGANKTQTAREIASRMNSDYINLDLFTESIIDKILTGNFEGSASKFYISFIHNFAETELSVDPTNHNKIETLDRKDIIKFIRKLIKALPPNRRCVIEGIYIYRYYNELKDIISKYPIILVKQKFTETVKMVSRGAIDSMSNIFTIMMDETADSVTWIYNEKKVFDEFANAILEDRYHQKAVYTKPYYPVYVLLTHSGTALATAIKKVTKDEFSHASISFDPSLRAMYSFAKDYADNSLLPGLVHEDITTAIFHRPIPYALYATLVPRAEFIEMKRKLYDIHRNAGKYAYNLVGLIKYAIGVNAETQNQLFCSEFVSTILNAKTDRTDGLRAAQVRPETFKELSRFKLIQKGMMTDYDMNVTLERVKTLKP